MNEKKLVSIIIPTYNSAKFLLEALSSAYNQTYTNIEIIIVDDGSTDETKILIKDFIYLNKTNNVFYFYKENGGVSSALNYGIKKSNGEYISWLSADDTYDLNKIQIQIKALEKINDKNTIIYSDWSFFGDVIKKNFILSQYSKKANFNNWIWAITSWAINGCTLLIPKKFFNKNLFDEKLMAMQDFQKWIDFYKQDIKIFFVENSLVNRRMHKEQTTNKLRNILLIEEQKIRINFYSTLSEEELSSSKKNPLIFFKWLKYLTPNIMDQCEQYKDFINLQILKFNKNDYKDNFVFYDYKKEKLPKIYLYQFKLFFFNILRKFIGKIFYSRTNKVK